MITKMMIKAPRDTRLHKIANSGPEPTQPDIDDNCPEWTPGSRSDAGLPAAMLRR